MELTVKQTSEKAGKNELPIQNWINEVISKIATKVISEIKPMLRIQSNQEPEIETLRKEMEDLKTSISYLMGKLQTQQVKSEQKIKAQNQRHTEKKANREPDKKDQSQEVDEEKAERWVREHTAEWLDDPCRFQRATGRTWRELAGNTGAKIAMNGKGEQSPRAYLHALESWKQCNAWTRLKAKVALEVVKNGG